MSRIAWCALVLATTGVLVAGCDKGDKDDKNKAAPAATPMTGVDGIIGHMGKLTDKLCACGDMACAEGVMKEMSTLKEPPEKPTKPQMEKAMALAQKMAECQKRLMTAAPPAPSIPPAPPPPTTP